MMSNKISAGPDTQLESDNTQVRTFPIQTLRTDMEVAPKT